MKQNIGQKIRSLRGWMPQAEVARRLGVGRAAVSSWESGDTAPSTGNLVRLAEVLSEAVHRRVTVDELLAPDEEQQVNQPSDWAKALPAPEPSQPLLPASCFVCGADCGGACAEVQP